MKKEFEVIFKFADVIQTIEAETEEKARELAHQYFNSDKDPKDDTYCYETEVSEVKE